VYTIGVMARLLNISPQTLRQFEREGLVEPSRTQNNMRLYSQNELVILQRICYLVKSEGVNIAGVRAVLRIERRYGVTTATVHTVQRRLSGTVGPDATSDTDETGDETTDSSPGEQDDAAEGSPARESVEGEDQSRQGPKGPGVGAPLGLLLAAMLAHLGGRWF